MCLQAVLLVLPAAILHATWNFATRKSAGNLAVLWLSLLLAGLAFLPVSIVAGWQGGLTWTGAGYLLLTAITHAVYFPLLAAAYRGGNISLVYPDGPIPPLKRGPATRRNRETARYSPAIRVPTAIRRVGDSSPIQV